MTRATIVMAGIALAFAVAAPAHAQHWPGNGALMRHFVVEVPAGALPSGPAIAEMKVGTTVTRARFEVPAAGAARVTLWVDYLSAAVTERQDVTVTSARGGVFRTTVEMAREGAQDHPLFLGSADELAAFSRAIAGDHKAEDAMRGIELGDRAEIAHPDCRRLAFARAVIVTLRGDEPLDGLLACAARGAVVMVIGHRTTAAEDREKTLARFDWGHASVAWGFGLIVPRSSLQASDLGSAVAQLDGFARRQAFETILSVSEGLFFEDDEAARRAAIPGTRLVLILLALYVAAIGPVGYFVGVRPRRPLLAWCWFPLVAIVATGALAAASVLWRAQPAEIELRRVRLVSPTGTGLEQATIRVQGASSERFSITVPWNDADLRGVARGFRFGTPFASPAGSLTLTDDRTAQRFTIDGITVGRFGYAGTSWMGPVDGPAPEAALQSGPLTIVNRTPQPIRRAVLIVGGKCHTLENLAAGARRVPTGVDCEKITRSGSSGARVAWPFTNIQRLLEERLAAGMYVLVAQVDGVAAGIEAQPAVRVRTTDVVVVIGPPSFEVMLP